MTQYASSVCLPLVDLSKSQWAPIVTLCVHFLTFIGCKVAVKIVIIWDVMLWDPVEDYALRMEDQASITFHKLNLSYWLPVWLTLDPKDGGKIERNAIPVKAVQSPTFSRQSAHSPTSRPPFTRKKVPGTHFC
jgi:hypothetical protein